MKSLRAAEIDAVTALEITDIEDDSIHIREKFIKDMSRFKNVQAVYACPFGVREPDHPAHPIRFITEFPIWLSAFSSLQRVDVEILWVRDIFLKDEQKALFDSMLLRIAEKTGVEGVYDEENTEYGRLGWVEGWGSLQSESSIRSWSEFNRNEIVQFRDVGGKTRLWTWEAEKGKTMDWTQELGRKWNSTGMLTYEDPLGEQLQRDLLRMEEVE